MKIVYIVILAVVGTAIGIFVFQNMGQQISLSFLPWHGEAPAALVILGVYVAGGVTGGALFTMMRQAVSKITAKAEPPAGSKK